MGNAHFKSSTNRAPRQTTPGEPGEHRVLRLQLKLLADVGLLGLPNAGKSTLINKVSAARAKVADYPFTTLVPSLGVVGAESDASFVIADIPGIIEGASDGAGLGAQFLRHLSRTRILLHLVDAAPMDGSSPLENLELVEAEVGNYSAALLERPIWTVLTKTDLIDADTRDRLVDDLQAARPDRPVHAISAATGAGLSTLTQALTKAVADIRERLATEPEFAAAEADLQGRINEDVLASALTWRPPRRRSEAGDVDDVEGPEVIYASGDDESSAHE